MNESSDQVKLEGRLTANSTVSGDVMGEDKDGKKTVVGTFTLAPAILTPTPTPGPVASAKVFSLESGKYTLTAEVTDFDLTADPAKRGPIDIHTTHVDVKNEDGEITIVDTEGRESPTILGELQNNEFSGSLTGPGVLVRLKGKLTANNKISGDLTGKDDRSPKKEIRGTFRLVKVKTFSLESGTHYTLTFKCTKEGPPFSDTVPSTQADVINEDGQIAISKHVDGKTAGMPAHGIRNYVRWVAGQRVLRPYVRWTISNTMERQANR